MNLMVVLYSVNGTIGHSREGLGFRRRIPVLVGEINRGKGELTAGRAESR